jgi:hypothetical protein
VPLEHPSELLAASPGQPERLVVALRGAGGPLVQQRPQLLAELRLAGHTLKGQRPRRLERHHRGVGRGQVGKPGRQLGLDHPTPPPPPALASRLAAAMTAALASVEACSQWAVRHRPTRGAGPGSTAAGAGRPLATDASRAASATVRAKVPTVSSDSANGSIPERLIRPKLGL